MRHAHALPTGRHANPALHSPHGGLLSDPDDHGDEPHDTLAQWDRPVGPGPTPEERPERNPGREALASAPTLDGPPMPATRDPAPSQPPSPDSPLIGRRLGGKFEVKAVIGRGGLGTVYRGVQLPIGRDVAIKVINRQRAGDPTLRQRFKREAAAAAYLKHSSIVALYDFGEDGGELYMVMELVDGRELREVLRERTRLDAQTAVDLTLQICEGLAHAHERGLVHRDLKPENIMVSTTSFGALRAQILDFGIVKTIRDDKPGLTLQTPVGHETRAGVIMGTPAYLAPEQAYARGVAPATDQYSLGVVLYEMLTGRLPYSKGSEFEIMTAHCVAPFPPMPAEAEVPPAIEAVVRKAMAKEQVDRFESVQAMAQALSAALGEASRRTVVETDATLIAPPPTEAPRRSRLVPALIGGGAVLAVGAWWVLHTPGPVVPDEVDARVSAVLVATPAVADAGAHFAVRDAGTHAPADAGRPKPPDAARPPVPDAAVASAATEPPHPRVATPHTDGAPRVRVTKLVADCEAEFAAIRQSSRNQSLSQGSGLCRRVGQLGQRVRSGQCTTPVPGIDKLMMLCGE